MLKLAAIIVALVLLVIAIELPNPFLTKGSPRHREKVPNPVAEKPLWKEVKDDETYTSFKL